MNASKYPTTRIIDAHEATTRPGEDEGVHVDVPRGPVLEVRTPSVEELLAGLDAGWDR